ncbi:FAD-dependent oxidoreductase [Bradyrhizobium sp. CB82]|uniref:NAD(P)/FAD-dependent oxidoreductase n=1 Tax=Bradyrhizobium sp. CB82 TaxID=3039159 RepID=UPI0024B0DDB5|nr:FAD-dependent oxidoreductase [Bradyrhizobium sp. CB82]WFU40021.1 FAD-dependent oxidoreductase [Bradyrhizobium sp. CB82]
MRRKLLIVGRSYGACEVASHDGENGYGEDIIIVSEEPELPYHRPPLSKGCLKDPSDQRRPLKAAAFYSDNDIGLELGSRVIDLDPGARMALLSNGTYIAFDTLALTVGTSARKLSCPGAVIGNVYCLRSIADARLLCAATRDAQKIFVVGTGFIGLEVESTLIRLQKQVTALDAKDRVLHWVVPLETSEYLASVHVSHGVKLLTSRAVQSLVDESRIVEKVVLQDGTSAVIVGIRSVPNLELARLLALQSADGIVVDSRSRTSQAYVFAAGDRTLFGGPFNTGGIRLESVQNVACSAGCDCRQRQGL